MDKSGILGGFVDEIGENIKQGAKTAVEQVTATGEYKIPKEQAQGQSQLKEMQQKEAKDTQEKLAEVRKRSGLEMMQENQRSTQLRPRERVEMQKQEELQAKKEKEAKSPPPLAVASKKGTKELMGVSG